MTKKRFNLRFATGSLSGKDFSLGPGELLFIGSDPTCGVHVHDDPSVSQKHACLYYESKNKILFKDLGSAQGTFVNGKRIKNTVTLRAGDRVTIGATATFRSMWWHALQPSRLTRMIAVKYSAITRNRHRAPSRSDAHTASRGFSLLLVASLACLGIAALIFGVNSDEKLSANASNRAKEWLQGSVLDAPTGGRLSEGGEREDFAIEKRDSPAESPNSRFVWDEIVNVSRRFGDPPPSVMDRSFLEEVELWIDRYTRNGGHVALLKRKQKYWPVIKGELRKMHLPIELGFVVWVESGFMIEARSDQGAAGLWQFLPGTAREYGLRVERGGVDERFDPRLSTRAAAGYFTRLLKMFGSDRYLLAIAAYNVGQNKLKRHQIAGAVRRARKADFWQVREFLPKETVDYVPKVLAAIIIGRNPERW